MHIVMRDERNTVGLLDLISELPSNLTMAEIGCYTGESTKLFMDSKKVDLLYAIDIWNTDYPIYGFWVAKDTNGNYEYTGYETAEMVFDKRMKGYNIVKYKSDLENAVHRLPGLDFVYIDADHDYKYVCSDIKNSLKVLKPNSFIGGHDYCNHSVARAVNELLGEPDMVFVDHSWLIKL